MYGEHGEFAYHYTTSEAAFDRILPSGQLRMSPLARLRDPVENKDRIEDWFTSLSWSPDDIERFRAAKDRVLDETKILSFTSTRHPKVALRSMCAAVRDPACGSSTPRTMRGPA
jgi:hypothetical protein